MSLATLAPMNFPFVGAGDARYLEFAELFVCFERVPQKAEAAAIAKRVPAPLRDTIEWKGRALWVASEQGVGRLVAAAYGKQPAKPSKLTTQSRFKIAPATAYARFNAAIEEWLEVAHGIVPILVAYRGEDSEAGGTDLTDWHHASARVLPKVLASLAADESGAAAQLGVRLLDAAKSAKVTIAGTLAKTLVKRAKEAEQDDDDDAPDWDALAATAKKALGAPARHYEKKRSAEDLEPALARLEKVLPLTAKRLRAMVKKGLAVRPGAKAAALTATEKALGMKLSKEHRALLEAFDGGQIGKVTFLGSVNGGAAADAELATFTRAWCGPALDNVIVAHTKRDDVVALPAGAASPASLIHGRAGWGGGSITRECKKLDSALDLVLKAGRVFNEG